MENNDSANSHGDRGFGSHFTGLPPGGQQPVLAGHDDAFIDYDMMPMFAISCGDGRMRTHDTQKSRCSDHPVYRSERTGSSSTLGDPCSSA